MHCEGTHPLDEYSQKEKKMLKSTTAYQDMYICDCLSRNMYISETTYGINTIKLLRKLEINRLSLKGNTPYKTVVVHSTI